MLARTPLTASPVWQRLAAHRDALALFEMRAAFATDPDRFERFSRTLTAAPASGPAAVLLDFSKNLIEPATLDLLCELADSCGLRAKIDAMFAGAPINTTEQRSVLHVALRDLGGQPLRVGGSDLMPGIVDVRRRFLAFAEDVRAGHWRGYAGDVIRDVVNIGIGGSDLGPQMIVAALRPYHDGPRVHFVSNIDGAHLSSTIKDLDPATTLFVVASKTFTTIETMTNARSARAWLLAHLQSVPGVDAGTIVARHFVAVSTNTEQVRAFGIDPANMFEFWDWVGGRYSLWSSVGVSIALAVGAERFMQLLAGAHALDTHFRAAPWCENLPVILGLLGIWYGNFWGAATQSIAPYYQHLHRFVAHIQQMDMESNGKRVTHAGALVDHATGPVIWGEPGTNGQHAYFQLLHQGPALVPLDFIVAAESVDRTLPDAQTHHQILLANCFAQTQALLTGKTAEQAEAEMRATGLDVAEAARLAPHREFSGNRPTNTLLVRRFDPFTIGMLTALYEQKVFVQGAIWDINSFDQWGVELGKQLATKLGKALTAPTEALVDLDGSTRGLVAQWQAWRASE